MQSESEKNTTSETTSYAAPTGPMRVLIDSHAPMLYSRRYLDQILFQGTELSPLSLTRMAFLKANAGKHVNVCLARCQNPRYLWLKPTPETQVKVSVADIYDVENDVRGTHTICKEGHAAPGLHPACPECGGKNTYQPLSRPYLFPGQVLRAELRERMDGLLGRVPGRDRHPPRVNHLLARALKEPALGVVPFPLMSAPGPSEEGKHLFYVALLGRAFTDYAIPVDFTDIVKRRSSEDEPSTDQ